MSDLLGIKRARAIFSRLDERERRVSLLSRQEANGWEPLLAWNPIATFSYKHSENADGAARFLSFVKEQTSRGRLLVGAISYDLGYELMSLAAKPRDDLNLPDIYFCAFDTYLRFDKRGAHIIGENQGIRRDIKKILKRAPALPASKNALNFRPSPSFTRSWYASAYTGAMDHIRDGDIYQINLSHRLEARIEDTGRALFLKMTDACAMPFQAYVQGDGFEILANSPERFLRARGNVIETYPIKGTRERGSSREEDARLRRELLENEKERAELAMITDLLRNDIGKVSGFGTVKIMDPRGIAAHPFVWHTYAHIRGCLQKNITAAAAIMSMFPGGSVTGCPKKRAMEIIAELEPRARGFYTGAIGYIEPSGNADMAITIRALIKKDDTVYLNVGGGVVYDSKMNSELEETFVKARPFVV